MHRHDISILCLLFVLSGCSREGGVSATGQSLKRIVSLSPSITRQIIDLDSEDLLAGVTSYSPAMKPHVSLVGSIVSPSVEAIALLKPDMILLSDEDGAVQHVERLGTLGIPMHKFRKNADFDTICVNYLELGRMLGKGALAESKLARYRKALFGFMKISFPAAKGDAAAAGPRVALFISAKPLVAVSDAAFLGSIIRDAGGCNVYGDVSAHYPLVSVESLIQRKPDIIVATYDDTIVYLKSAIEQVGGDTRIQWYSVPPDHLTHYTPSDYVKSVEILASLFSRWRQQ